MDHFNEMLSRIHVQLVDENHPLMWFKDDLEYPSLLVLESKVEPGKVLDVKGLTVRKTQRKNGNWYIAFYCQNPEFSRVFRSFCHDQIHSTLEVKPENGPEKALDVYSRWRTFFSRSSTLLSETAIQGLMAEMIALRDCLIPEFGPSASIQSWMIKYHSKQDFLIGNTWYEIKSLVEGDSSFTVSSLEQLNRNDGFIVSIVLRHSNPESEKCMTLNSLFDEICSKLSEGDSLSFRESLSVFGFQPGPNYDDYCFEFVSGTCYEVRDGFPRLTPSSIPYPAITHVEYNIETRLITEFEVKKWN